MKRIVSLIIAVISVFQLTGCGSKTASEVTIDYGHETSKKIAVFRKILSICHKFTAK